MSTELAKLDRALTMLAEARTLPTGWDGYGNEFEGNEPEVLERAA